MIKVLQYNGNTFIGDVMLANARRKIEIDRPAIVNLHEDKLQFKPVINIVPNDNTVTIELGDNESYMLVDANDELIEQYKGYLDYLKSNNV